MKQTIRSFVGMDVHKATISIRGLSSNGTENLHKSLVGLWVKLRRFQGLIES